MRREHASAPAPRRRGGRSTMCARSRRGAASVCGTTGRCPIFWSMRPTATPTGPPYAARSAGRAGGHRGVRRRWPTRCSGLAVARYTAEALATEFAGLSLRETRRAEHVTPAGVVQPLPGYAWPCPRVAARREAPTVAPAAAVHAHPTVRGRCISSRPARRG